MPCSWLRHKIQNSGAGMQMKTLPSQYTLHPGPYLLNLLKEKFQGVLIGIRHGTWQTAKLLARARM